MAGIKYPVIVVHNGYLQFTGYLLTTFRLSDFPTNLLSSPPEIVIK
jgi:hypothetical protein